MIPARSGPLAGVRVVEIAGLGPGPFAGMMLADAGADVIRVDRVGPPDPYARTDVLSRNRRSIAIDLRSEPGLEVLLRLVDGADLIFEGFRPGVAERLGFGPEVCLERNPRIVYGRMTGWGQDGPLAPTAGHDINYIAAAGALRPVGHADSPPPPPLNFVGDFGGGGMLLAFGLVCALMEARASGTGQVVDAAMVDGVGAQTAFIHGLMASNLWSDERESNLLDGAAPFYRCYRCADGEFLAVGAVEEKFYNNFLLGLGLTRQDWPQHDQSMWPDQRARIATIIATRARDEWASHFAGLDACVTPVLSLTEAPQHPHAKSRASFQTIDGVTHPSAAPRFSRYPTAAPPISPRLPGADSDAVLSEIGLTTDEIADLRAAGTVQ
jgi:alpha-methylacyl-CoA racemase